MIASVVVASVCVVIQVEQFRELPVAAENRNPEPVSRLEGKLLQGLDLHGKPGLQILHVTAVLQPVSRMAARRAIREGKEKIRFIFRMDRVKLRSQ